MLGNSSSRFRSSPSVAVFPCLEPVGEDPLLAVVGDPEGDAVEEEAAWVVVGVVQGVLRERLAAREVVGEEALLPTVEHPHRLVAGPDAARIAVAVGECDVALLGALAAREVVGEEAVAAAVGDPGVVPSDHTPRGARLVLVELELAVLHALAGLEVVGVDGVVGAVAVLEDPERRAVGPRARGLVVTAVEVLDVARHGPLEVDHARAGAAAAASATTAAGGDTAAAATSEAAAAAAGGRRHHDDGTGRHGDGHIDARGGPVLVGGSDRHHVGGFVRGVQDSALAYGDLGGAVQHLEAG